MQGHRRIATNGAERMTHVERTVADEGRGRAAERALDRGRLRHAESGTALEWQATINHWLNQNAYLEADLDHCARLSGWARTYLETD